jgi:hypothetical protein
VFGSISPEQSNSDFGDVSQLEESMKKVEARIKDLKEKKSAQTKEPTQESSYIEFASKDLVEAPPVYNPRTPEMAKVIETRQKHTSSGSEFAVTPARVIKVQPLNSIEEENENNKSRSETTELDNNNHEKPKGVSGTELKEVIIVATDD